MDFDTQMSSLKNNQLLYPDCDPHPNLEIFLPYQITHNAMVDKLIEYDKCNSLIVIDSLNGLLDYFNFYKYEISGYDHDVEGHKRVANLNRTTAKHAGYKSLNLIKILFGCHTKKEIPIVMTSYQSQSSIDRLISETITEDAIPYQEINHFRRISNLVSLLEYFQDKDDLFITVLKKTPGPAYKNLSGFPNFPHTRKIVKKPSADSQVYSLRL